MSVDTAWAMLHAMGWESRRINDLTEPQRRFAARHEAVPAVRSGQDPRMIFMYRDEAHRTSRWLVDETGQVIDTATFHHAYA
jgi:hypothetical protein